MSFRGPYKGGRMSSKNFRLGRLILSWLLALTASYASAQTQPPTESSTSSPYSPIVSFGTLPVLQSTTPIPGSNHVPGDFNGDGTSDLLWYNPALSQVGYWTMTASVGASYSGGAVARTGVHTFNVTQGYFVGAVGDFNNDGYADLVFTSANRDLWLWTNNQHGGFTSTRIGTYPSNWQLIGAGDIDGDGYDDLLWLDPSDCQFAYWTMHGSVRAGYRIIPITCGYYPVGIGYYTPTNRLSILWTSPAHDLYIWDSAGSGFNSYDLTTDIGTFAGIWAIGGGYMGNDIGIESCVPSNVNCTNGMAYGSVYSRTFDAKGDPTGFVGATEWDGGAVYNLGSGGYIIQGNGVNATALYAINQGNATIMTAGLPGSNPSFSGNAPVFPNGGGSWNYPVGWWVVGAPANGAIAPPWQ